MSIQLSHNNTTRKVNDQAIGQCNIEITLLGLSRNRCTGEFGSFRWKCIFHWMQNGAVLCHLFSVRYLDFPFPDEVDSRPAQSPGVWMIVANLLQVAFFLCLNTTATELTCLHIKDGNVEFAFSSVARFEQRHTFHWIHRTVSRYSRNDRFWIFNPERWTWKFWHLWVTSEMKKNLSDLFDSWELCSLHQGPLLMLLV